MSVEIDGVTYLTAKEVAARLNTSVQYLANRRNVNKGIPSTTILGRVLYSVDDVTAHERGRKNTE